MRLKDLCRNELTAKERELLPASFDIVGDILIFSDFPEELEKKEKLVGKMILDNMKNVKVICKKIGKYAGRFRLPKLKIIAGARRKETRHKENNVVLELNVEKVYFSPRLSTERKRVSGLVNPGEDVLVMFSGCAPYPINIAKNSKARSIYGIEVNPAAHRYGQMNVKLNKADNVVLLQGDVRQVLPMLHKRFDRIVMPLPRKGKDYLKLAFSKLRKGGIVHLYIFLREEQINTDYLRDYVGRYARKFKIKKITKCGQFAPGKYRVCTDIFK